MSDFGDFLRAARLGFRRLPPPMPPVWMRIEAGGPPWRVQLAWDARQMGDMSCRGNHVVWWEGDASELITASPTLLSLDAGAVPREMLLSDDGREIRSLSRPAPAQKRRK